jgi:hypothetical protein
MSVLVSQLSADSFFWEPLTENRGNWVYRFPVTFLRASARRVAVKNSSQA